MAQLWLIQTMCAQRLAQLPVPVPLLFLDVETTRDRVVELAMIRFAPGYPPWIWHSYVQPGSEAAHHSRKYWNTEIHGVTPAMVHGRPTFPHIAPVVLQALEGATVVAHNVSFEQRFLGEELRRLGRDFTQTTMCTLKLARDLVPELENHKLDTMASRFDIRNPAPHRALGDTFTSLWLLLAMLEQYSGKRPLAEHVREAMRAADNRRLNPWTR
jgi:DNA polymerase III subunit epsilon